MCNHEYFIKVSKKNYKGVVIGMVYCCITCEKIIEVDGDKVNEELELKLIPGLTLELQLPHGSEILEGYQADNFISLVKGQAQASREMMARKGINRKVENILYELSLLNDNLLEVKKLIDEKKFELQTVCSHKELTRTVKTSDLEAFPQGLYKYECTVCGYTETCNGPNPTLEKKVKECKKLKN